MIIHLLKSAFLMLFFIFVSAAVMSQVTVTGKVTTKENPNGIGGASIQEKGTRNTVVSADDGTFSIQVKSNNAVLLFNFVGMKPQSVSVANRTQISVELEEDISTLSDVVVTAGRQPVRKLETTQAVDIIGPKLLKAIKPESFAEAVTLTPGVFANNSQGRRGGVVIRGFPDGNPLGGLVYTSILLDGLPAFGSAGRLPDAGFGFDGNIEKIEVVRGSTATVYGRSAAAGVINIISKTGGENLSGSVRVSNFDNILGGNNFNYRADWNLNGSLTKDKLIRFNVGGWFMNDNGFRNTGRSDKGYQVRGNFDFLSADNKQKVRLGFIAADYSFQNLTDLPLNMNTMQLAANWKNTSTFIFPQFNTVTYSIFGNRASTTPALSRPSVAVNNELGQQITRNIATELDRNYSKNTQVNFTYERRFSGGWAIDNKFRYQALYSATKYPFSIPSFYNSNGVATVSTPATLGGPGTSYAAAGGAFRLLLDGDAYDDDIINELRLKKTWETKKVKHNFQVGHYFSKTHLRPTTYSYTHFVNPTNPDSLALIFGTIAGARIVSGAGTLGNLINFASYNPAANPQRGAITRRGDYTEQVNSIFAGHEMKFNDKFSVSLGLRYDWIMIRMQERKLPFDSAINRKEIFSDYSASAGFNYLFNRSTSLYFNINRAFRMPDYTAFTSLEYTATTSVLTRFPNGARPDNEIITSAEIGFRKQAAELGIDLAVFYNKINNRLASIFENGLLQSRSFGSNRIMGAEASVSYTPTSFLKGLSIRTSLTLQNAEFSKFEVSVGSSSVIGKPLSGGAASLDVDPTGNLFGQKLITKGTNQYAIDVAGNKLPNVPAYIWSTVATYTHKWFGLDFSSSVNGKRYADATNTFDLGDLTVLNAGGYVKWQLKAKQEIRIGLQCKNLTNAQGIQQVAGLADNAVALGQRQTTPNFINPTNGLPIFAQGYLQLPRRWIAYLSFEF
jgi:outer membrane receptor protein involved in Fe transport